MAYDPYRKAFSVTQEKKQTSNFNIKKKSRRQLYAERFAFNKEDTIPVNALDLIDELVEQERLSFENKMLRSRIETLEALLLAARPLSSYTVYDVKGRLS